MIVLIAGIACRSELLAHLLLGANLENLRALQLLTSSLAHLQIVDGTQLLEERADLLLVRRACAWAGDSQIGRALTGRTCRGGTIRNWLLGRRRVQRRATLATTIASLRLRSGALRAVLVGIGTAARAITALGALGHGIAVLSRGRETTRLRFRLIVVVRNLEQELRY